MTFADDLTGYTAADLIDTFPGIPRSTAYDWLKGTREPAVYLQPAVLAQVRHYVRKKKSNKASVRGFKRWAEE